MDFLASVEEHCEYRGQVDGAARTERAAASREVKRHYPTLKSVKKFLSTAFFENKIQYNKYVKHRERSHDGECSRSFEPVWVATMTGFESPRPELFNFRNVYVVEQKQGVIHCPRWNTQGRGTGPRIWLSLSTRRSAYPRR